MPSKSKGGRVQVPLEIDFTFEEPSATRVDGVPADVAQVVAQVSERIEPHIAVLAGQGGDHVGREPVTGAEDVFARGGVCVSTE